MKESVFSTAYFLRSPPRHLWTGDPTGCLCFPVTTPISKCQSKPRYCWTLRGCSVEQDRACQNSSGMAPRWLPEAVADRDFSIRLFSSLCLWMALLLLVLMVLFFSHKESSVISPTVALCLSLSTSSEICGGLFSFLAFFLLFPLFFILENLCLDSQLFVSSSML